MNIYDMHIHSTDRGYTANALLSSMAEAGVYGGCVISAPPKENHLMSMGGNLSFEERISSVVSPIGENSERIFPVLWIHPDEKGIIDKLKLAKDAGIVAFKMICNDYYVYEEKSMAVLREIARLGMPVVFHSGILWDGNVSSKYNRPLNWEALLDIDGIRFSMGHCSWPWIDECIALYGKFLNARYEGKNVEMFFDITPGTPEIYRKELLTKLYTVGYNVGDNIMFGLDCTASSWSSEWANKWLKIDGGILDELGVSQKYRKKLYGENFLRFIGKTSDFVEITAPKPDNSHSWSAEEPSVKQIIEKWYKRLSFPKEFDKDFYKLLSQVKISDSVSPYTYDYDCEDGKRNLLSFLYMCEDYEKRALGKGIPEKVINDTLSDIVIWCINWSNIKGELFLGEISWLKRHLKMELFRIGRLQFCMAGAERDIPKYGIKKGDNVIEIHIPRGEKLSYDDCTRSVEKAKDFFKRYYPDFDYSVFTCHSWLLDRSLEGYLSESSGIIGFGRMFDRVQDDDSLELIRYLFTFDTTPLNLKGRYPTSSLAAKIQKVVLSGEMFHETLGVYIADR